MLALSGASMAHDSDNKISILDGVDNKRNFPEHWNYDEEGSASIVTDQTYRGPSAGSELRRRR